MATRVRSYSKINLGLRIGAVRDDGFHGLTTLYQTLALHDCVTVSVREPSRQNRDLGHPRIALTTNHAGVPVDSRNTAWKMVELALGRLGIAAEVAIHIEKALPVQGGMGAGSANAAAALLGLERELGVALPEAERMEVAAAVGSDVPLFLVGGAVLGAGRGELVSAVADFPATACVVAVPEVGVSTPRAFQQWDAGPGLSRSGHPGDPGSVGDLLTSAADPANLRMLSHVYASVPGGQSPTSEMQTGTSGIVRGRHFERQQGECAAEGLVNEESGAAEGNTLNGLAENTLLALVRTGIENDFEQVVFPQYPLLRDIKHELMGIGSSSPALYAALSGSGSALFGLYGSVADASAAQRRVQAFGCKALLTETLPREEYWRTMFAE